MYFMWLCVSMLGHVEKLWYVNNEIVLVFIQILLEALSRCVAVLTASSKPDDMAVQVMTKHMISLSLQSHFCMCTF